MCRSTLDSETLNERSPAVLPGPRGTGVRPGERARARRRRRGRQSHRRVPRAPGSGPDAEHRPARALGRPVPKRLGIPHVLANAGERAHGQVRFSNGNRGHHIRNRQWIEPRSCGVDPPRAARSFAVRRLHECRARQVASRLQLVRTDASARDGLPGARRIAAEHRQLLSMAQGRERRGEHGGRLRDLRSRRRRNPDDRRSFRAVVRLGRVQCLPQALSRSAGRASQLRARGSAERNAGRAHEGHDRGDGHGDRSPARQHRSGGARTHDDHLSRGQRHPWPGHRRAVLAAPRQGHDLRGGGSTCP